MFWDGVVVGIAATYVLTVIVGSLIGILFKWKNF